MKQTAIADPPVATGGFHGITNKKTHPESRERKRADTQNAKRRTHQTAPPRIRHCIPVSGDCSCRSGPGDKPTRPGPLKVEPADTAINIKDFTRQIEPWAAPAFHGLEIDLR